MLDIIQFILADTGIGSCRIDGGVTGKDRQGIVDAFNMKSVGSPSVCLLTTKACGYGITLTGADRVIMFDPSWNPAEDKYYIYYIIFKLYILFIFYVRISQ
jgi:SNF2 family DNA or RNA helicase